MNETVKKGNIKTILLVIMLIVYFAAICLINFSATPSMFDGDMYCDYRYAALAWEHKSVFPDGWVFGNQLNLVSTPVLAAFLYGLFLDLNTAMAVACTIMAILTVISFDWMIKPLFQSLESRLLAVVVFMTSVLYYGTAVHENVGWSLFFTMCSYYAGYSTTAFLAFGIYHRSWKGLDKKGWSLFLIVCAMSFGTGIQSIRQTVIMVLPMAAVEFLRIISDVRKGEHNHQPLWVASGIAASNILGLITVRMLPIRQMEIFGKIELTPLSELFMAGKNCLMMILTMWSNGTREGYGILFILLLICMAALFLQCVDAIRERSLVNSVIPALMGISILCIVGIDVVTTMYVRPRYYFVLYPMVAYLAAYLYEHRKKIRIVFLLFLTVFFCCACMRELPDVCRQAWNSKDEESYEVSRYLLENGYTTIYSTWGHGQEYAIAASGIIEMGYWNDSADPFVPMGYLYDSETYEADPDKCVYIFDSAGAAEIGKQKAMQKNVELTLLRYLQDSDTYIYTATENLLQLYR